MRGNGSARQATRSSTASSSTWRNCARWWTSPRCSSGATADRCTSPARVRCPSSACTARPLAARSAPWSRPVWPPNRSNWTDLRRAGRATSGGASRGISGASGRLNRRSWPRRPSGCSRAGSEVRELMATGADRPAGVPLARPRHAGRADAVACGRFSSRSPSARPRCGSRWPPGWPRSSSRASGRRCRPGSGRCWLYVGRVACRRVLLARPAEQPRADQADAALPGGARDLFDREGQAGAHC